MQQRAQLAAAGLGGVGNPSLAANGGMQLLPVPVPVPQAQPAQTNTAPAPPPVTVQVQTTPPGQGASDDSGSFGYRPPSIMDEAFGGAPGSSGSGSSASALTSHPPHTGPYPMVQAASERRRA